ncbi:MAG TPA: HupE/UreJ family protein [Gemmatimonadales bacterium]|nr:HupE/UreJ family protein [Gemmatimonadales bacterium]
MSELLAFIRLGFHHITDPEALDHILFLLALAAIYRGRDWRDSLWVISAFTIGHSITLALAVTGALRLSTPLIEFLIPLTIVATGIENIVVRRRDRAPLRGRYRPVFAGVFGLVHGAGFANYLTSLFTGSIVLPLFGFNVGIELGQLVVLALAGLALAGLDRLLGLLRRSGGAAPAFRLRVVAVSGVVVLVAARMAAARAPW